MVKKIFIASFLICMAISGNVLAYTDVDGHWAEKEITNLSLNGIMSGYTDNSFKPNQNMTRAELVTVINRLLGNSVQNTRYVPDINAKDWFYVDIRKGIESGVIQGNSEGYVRPNDLVTREEAILMLQRALVPPDQTGITYSFSDASDISEWSKEAVNTFWKSGYVSGYSDNTIRPKNYITRAEVVKIITNMIDVYATFGEFTGEVHGNVLVTGKNVTLKNITIDGDLIVVEGAENTLTLENIIIDGDLVVRTDVNIPTKNFVLKGSKYDFRTTKNQEETSSYINDEYGISFSIPEKATVVFIENENQKVNYRTKNLMTIRINQDDALYFTTFNSALFKERSRFDVAYSEMDRDKIGIYTYAVYGSEKDESYFVYLKRDNVEYSIYFYNIENINVIDSLVNSIRLYNGEKIVPHSQKTYRNPKLYLKFSYLDYVTIDDSYNTGIVNNEEGFFKMFIQVNNIVDMSDYTIEELKEILVSLEDTDGEIIDSQIKKVYTYDAIEYTVKDGEKLTKSLYIVISTKLYHFIFVGEESKMNTVGVDIYNDIINSMEF